MYRWKLVYQCLVTQGTRMSRWMLVIKWVGSMGCNLTYLLMVNGLYIGVITYNPLIRSPFSNFQRDIQAPGFQLRDRAFPKPNWVYIYWKCEILSWVGGLGEYPYLSI